MQAKDKAFMTERETQGLITGPLQTVAANFHIKTSDKDGVFSRQWRENTWIL